jgi:hypothetical protein
MENTIMRRADVNRCCIAETKILAGRRVRIDGSWTTHYLINVPPQGLVA